MQNTIEKNSKGISTGKANCSKINFLVVEKVLV